MDVKYMWHKFKWKLKVISCGLSETGHTYTTYRVGYTNAGMGKVHFMRCIKCGKKKRKFI